MELKDPVQQVKLVKKVGLAAGAELQSDKLCFSPMVTSRCRSTLSQAGSQLRCVSEEQQGGALLLLDSCLHTLGLLYVSLTPKNPLRPAIARSTSLSVYSVSGMCIFFSIEKNCNSCNNNILADTQKRNTRKESENEDGSLS